MPDMLVVYMCEWRMFLHTLYCTYDRLWLSFLIIVRGIPSQKKKKKKFIQLSYWLYIKLLCCVNANQHLGTQFIHVQTYSCMAR